MATSLDVTKKRDLPKYIFERGNQLWYRLKDASGEWKNRPTGFNVTQVEQAAQLVRGLVRGMKLRAQEAERAGRDDYDGALTMRAYLLRWVKDREDRGIGAAKTEHARILKYIAPEIGDISIEELRPRHVRDLVRKLKARTGDDKIAPRTIIHIYNTLHNAMESAVVEEIVLSNPVKLNPGELPKKVDADREWRAQATYTVREVERLISAPIIPVQRRVQYALKALTGMRHGEVAALCFRHLDYNAEPLARIHVVQAYSTPDRIVKSTKSEETRAVPMHPTLAKILAAWKLEHWPRIYGRQPTDDDFVVPTRVHTCVDGGDAVAAMKDDLDALKLRKEAGKRRHRGGHDLRSWYKTRLIEDGADSLIIRRTTHAPPKDVDGGYERFSWATMCREVAKLRVEILDGQVLPLVTDSLRAEAKARARWSSKVTPLGLEPLNIGGLDESEHKVSSKDNKLHETGAHGGGYTRPTSVTKLVTATRMLERAIRSGDSARALRIVQELKGDAPEFVAEHAALRATRRESRRSARQVVGPQARPRR